MNTEELRQFLLDANAAGYATGQERQWTKESDGSTTIPFEHGDWRMSDNFFGGEPYGGRIVVFYQKKPVWMMVYYGRVLPIVAASEVYPILQKALTQMPIEAPFRGPRQMIVGEFRYVNSWQGELNLYAGEERIFKKDAEIYVAQYMGGLVDQ